MKLKKKLIKIGGVILLVVTIGASIFVYNYKKNESYAIDLVKNQTSEIAPDVTFHQAYDKYLTNLSYTYYKDSNKNQFVCVSGRLYLKDREKISDLKLTYLINENDGSLKFYDMSIDGAKYNELEALILKVKVYDSYDGNNV